MHHFPFFLSELWPLQVPPGSSTAPPNAWWRRCGQAKLLQPGAPGTVLPATYWTCVCVGGMSLCVSACVGAYVCICLCTCVYVSVCKCMCRCVCV